MATTPYAETEALLAVMEGRDEDAERIVGSLTSSEQRQFRDHLATLSSVVESTAPTIL